MSTSRQRSGRRLAVAAVLVVALPFTACSSDDDPADGGASGSTTTAAEYKISSDADVAAGLAKMQGLVDDLEAAGPDTAKAAAARDAMTPIWLDIEGTIKQNEPDIYVDIEDSMSLLSASVEGDEEKGATGLTDIRASMADYLAKYPG